MSAFLLCVKNPGQPWGIDSWHTNQAWAEKTASALVHTPYMAEIASVFSVGGSDALPMFTLVKTAKAER